MPSWFYPAALAALSLTFIVLEAAFPRRRAQRFWGPGVAVRASDFAHLMFNGHFLGAAVFIALGATLAPLFDRALSPLLGTAPGALHLTRDWPLALQILTALVVIDFIQWNVHRMLHAVPWLWELHKTHHSVRDGEMSWIVSFRFAWGEVVLYQAVQYLPLALLGFAPEALMVHAILGTAIGHLNHANLRWDWGPLRYVFNGPRMHLWHHDRDGTRACNFAIIFSAWDWIFGTAKLPEAPPRSIGFRGDDSFPRDLVAQSAWPIQASSTDPARRAWTGWIAGGTCLAGLLTIYAVGA